MCKNIGHSKIHDHLHLFVSERLNPTAEYTTLLTIEHVLFFCSSTFIQTIANSVVFFDLSC